MDDLGFNKIAGAVLATGLGMLILMKLPGVLMNDNDAAGFAYTVGPIETVVEGDVEELPFPQPEWIAAMDAAKGAKVFKKCTSCHNAEAGGANGTGPNLYNVVMAEKGVHAGYNYSGKLAATGGAWTYESLDAFLKKPSNYAPGTKMNFIGLKKEEDRAAVIEYLRIAAATPVPQPEPAFVEMTVETPLEEPTVETPQSTEQPTVDPTDVIDETGMDDLEMAEPETTDAEPSDSDMDEQKPMSEEKTEELE